MSYYESQRDERIAYALESIAKELGKMNKPKYVAEEKPAVETEEVKYGEWKRVETGTICTNCHKVYDEDFEFSYKVIKEYFKRCPECGAKMDGGKANDL